MTRRIVTTIRGALILLLMVGWIGSSAATPIVSTTQTPVVSSITHLAQSLRQRGGTTKSTCKSGDGNASCICPRYELRSEPDHVQMFSCTEAQPEQHIRVRSIEEKIIHSDCNQTGAIKWSRNFSLPQLHR